MRKRNGVLRYIRVGVKTDLPVYHENFEYYQPNDHTCGDCAIRAVSKAIGVSWEESLKVLYDAALKVKEAPTACESVTEALIPYGFEWHAIRPKKGEKRATVAEFAEQNKDKTIICRVSGHLVCAKDGKYYDIWDSGAKSLYGYWIK